MLLVEEYAAGTHSYQLGFPKGLIDPEVPEEAANRELKEEIGLGARTLTPIHTVSLAPGFLNAPMYIFLAQDFYEESLPGDEPEPLTLVPWPLSDAESLLSQENFTEARSICALLFVQKLFAGKCMSEVNTKECLDHAIQCAIQAGELVLETYESGQFEQYNKWMILRSLAPTLLPTNLLKGTYQNTSQAPPLCLKNKNTSD